MRKRRKRENRRKKGWKRSPTDEKRENMRKKWERREKCGIDQNEHRKKRWDVLRPLRSWLARVFLAFEYFMTGSNISPLTESLTAQAQKVDAQAEMRKVESLGETHKNSTYTLTAESRWRESYPNNPLINNTKKYSSRFRDAICIIGQGICCGVKDIHMTWERIKRKIKIK